MVTWFNKITFYIMSLLGTLLVLPFIFWWKLYAADDLLYQLMQPAIDTENTIDIGENRETVWNKIIKWTTDIWPGWITPNPSIIVKVTRFILVLLVAISVTMILYNWMTYIIETGQWKDWKSLIKNVLYIVVGILISLFSVVMIKLIQSIPTTIEEELISESGNRTDNEVLKWKTWSWEEVWDRIADWFENFEDRIRDKFW